jgi:hypothetical protein
MYTGRYIINLLDILFLCVVDFFIMFKAKWEGELAEARGGAFGSNRTVMGIDFNLQ